MFDGMRFRFAMCATVTLCLLNIIDSGDLTSYADFSFRLS